MNTKYLVFTIMLLIISGCTTAQQQTDNGKIKISTTFYPVEEITIAVTGNLAEVSVIIPAGTEPHSFEPNPKQIAEFSENDVFVTMGLMFEEIENDFINANSDIAVIETEDVVNKLEAKDHHDEHEEEHEEGHDEHEEEHEEGHDEHDHGAYDPHTWLSIENMIIMTDTIAKELSKLYPEHEKEFTQNAQNYIAKLETLEKEFSLKLSNCNKDKIIVNHKAFGYLADKYEFEQISVAGFTPESEPSPKAIQSVIDTAKEYELKFVFSEGQLDKKTAQTIANDLNGEVLELYPIKINDNIDYFSLMRENLASLSIGLECE